MFTMRKQLHLFAAFFAAFTIASGFLASTARAAEGDTSITLAPTKSRFTIDAGTERQDKLVILNTGKEGYDFIVYTRPYEVKDITYDPDFSGKASNSDAYKWVRFEKTQYRLEAGQRVEVPYTIQAPAGAAPGGHYGVIFAETKAPRATSQSVVTNKRVGMAILATVNGKFKQAGEFASYRIDPVQFRSPLTTSTNITNSGNSDFVASLEFTVKDAFGNVKYHENKEFSVFPSTTRAMTMEWADSPWFGLFNVSVNSRYLDQSVEKSSYVLIVPRWMLVVIAVLVLVGVVYAVRRRR